MMLNDKAKALLDKLKQFATISTIEPDGRPQSSVVWYVRDGDDVLVSTVADRRKHKNMVRDPRVTLLVYDAENPYEYVEIRGRVQMTTEGGRELIDDLARAYMGADRYTMDDGTDNVRVVCRIVAEKVVSR